MKNTFSVHYAQKICINCSKKQVNSSKIKYVRQVKWNNILELKLWLKAENLEEVQGDF